MIFRWKTCPVAILMLAISATSLFAQNRPATAAPANDGMRIALLDLGYVFENNARFKNQIEVMKQDVEAFEKQLQTQVESQRKLMETYAVGSPDYKRAEETATKKMADLKADMELKRKDVMEKEAKLYFDTYQDIKRVVDDIAKRARIDLVLRYERQPIASPAGIVNPRDTLKLLNQPVIYDNGLDITDIVVKMLAPAGNSAQRPAPSTR